MNINNMSESQKTYNLMKKSLDASTTRSKVIANNLSNINTKGYKRYTVSFEDSLKQSVDNINMQTTSKKHINDGTSFGDIKVSQDKTTSMREDGNNVDIDNEMTNMAANTLMYNAMITQVNSRIALEKTVINGR